MSVAVVHPRYSLIGLTQFIGTIYRACPGDYRMADIAVRCRRWTLRAPLGPLRADGKDAGFDLFKIFLKDR